MTEEQIADVIARFARSARNSVALGFKSSNYDARTTRDPRELEAMGQPPIPFSRDQLSSLV